MNHSKSIRVGGSIKLKRAAQQTETASAGATLWSFLNTKNLFRPVRLYMRPSPDLRGGFSGGFRSDVQAEATDRVPPVLAVRLVGVGTAGLPRPGIEACFPALFRHRKRKRHPRVAQVVDFYGGRHRVRTCDPCRVKEGFASFCGLMRGSARAKMLCMGPLDYARLSSTCLATGGPHVASH